MDPRSEQEFTEFVAARSVALMRAARLLTGDPHRAEELVQTALTKLAGRWRHVDAPEAYARRIIYHDQVSLWRRRGRLLETSAVQVPEQPVADDTAQVQRRLDLQAALARLGPRQRAVLVLRYFEDLPDEEIAHVLGCSAGTVRSQAYRALARLRELVPDLSDRPVSALNPSTKE